MSSLLVLAVAYAGIGGKGADKVDAQVRTLLAKGSEIVDTEVSAADRHTLVKHGAGSKAIISRIDAASVVAGEVDKKGKKLTVVVYGHDGGMVDLIELPLHKKKLAATDLSSLHDTVIPDVERLDSKGSGGSEPVATDDENPVGDSGDKKVAAADDASEGDKPGASDASVTTTTEGKLSDDGKHKHATVFVSLGAGPRTRTFAPGPTMVQGYRSDPVPGGELDAELTPTRWASIGGELDRTLVMSSNLATGKTDTTMLRWRADGALALPLGPIDLGVVGGIGGRDFVISAPAPTPDGHYIYAIAGGRVGIHLGDRVAIRATAAYEPVIGGPENLKMPSGSATRAGLELSGAIQVAATEHWLVTGAAGYQRFTWTWQEGVATDEYPEATLSVGAQY